MEPIATPSNAEKCRYCSGYGWYITGTPKADTHMTCEACKGTGLKPIPESGTNPLKCPICGHRYQGLFCKHDVSKEVMPHESPTAVHESPKFDPTGEASTSESGSNILAEKPVSSGGTQEPQASGAGESEDACVASSLTLAANTPSPESVRGKGLEDVILRQWLLLCVEIPWLAKQGSHEANCFKFAAQAVAAAAVAGKDEEVDQLRKEAAWLHETLDAKDSLSATLQQEIAHLRSLNESNAKLSEGHQDHYFKAKTEIATLRGALEKAKSFEHEFHMYRDAWFREIGGKIFAKSHEIDGLVLTTRWLKRRSDLLPEELAKQVTRDSLTDSPRAALAHQAEVKL